jgi:hypothetical protein
MRIQACPRCESRDLGLPTASDGVWLGGGELQFYVCRACQYRGMPVEFDNEAEYATFVRTHFDEEPDDAGAEVDWPEPGLLERLHVMPVVIGVLGLGGLVAGLLMALGGLLLLLGGAWMAFASLLVGALVGLVGLSFVLVAHRAWVAEAARVPGAA